MPVLEKRLEELPGGPDSADCETYPAVSVARGKYWDRLRVLDFLVVALVAEWGIRAGISSGGNQAAVIAYVVVFQGAFYIGFRSCASRRVSHLKGVMSFGRTVRDIYFVYLPLVVLALLLPAVVRLPVLLTCIAATGIGLLVDRLLLRGWVGFRQKRSGAQGDRVLVAGDVDAAAAIAKVVRNDTSPFGPCGVVGVRLPTPAPPRYRELGDGGTSVQVFGDEHSVAAAARWLDASIVAVAPSSSIGPGELRELAWELSAIDVELVVLAGPDDVSDRRVTCETVGGMPVLHITGPDPARSFCWAKRVLDIVVASLGLAVSAPVMAAIAIAIKCEGPGPVLFRSERVGAGGVPFIMTKFRSMSDAPAEAPPADGAHSDGAGPLFKLRSDPRVTRVGRLIRRYSVDELPQFFDVLAGRMSIVGPRPAIADEVAAYPPEMRRRLLVRPGMTGAWQVGGRSDLEWAECVRLDVGYVENWSLVTDLAIIVRTFRAVLRHSGAY